MLIVISFGLTTSNNHYLQCIMTDLKLYFIYQNILVSFSGGCFYSNNFVEFRITRDI